MPGIYLELGKGTGRSGEVLELPGTEFLIGRSSGCDVRIESKRVSREHVCLNFDGREWIAEDQGSRNGTYLNGRRLSSAVLRPLDSIRLGKARGARVRVLSLDPAPPMTVGQGSEPSRSGRVARKARARPRRGPTSPRPPSEDLRPPASPGPVPRASAPASGALDALRATHVLVILGMTFGLLTAWEAWGVAFPYLRVSAPVLWALRGIEMGASDLLARNGEWLLRFLLALWFGLIGLALERPWRRLLPLLLLGVVHGLAIAAFGR